MPVKRYFVCKNYLYTRRNQNETLFSNNDSRINFQTNFYDEGTFSLLGFAIVPSFKDYPLIIVKCILILEWFQTL